MNLVHRRNRLTNSFCIQWGSPAWNSSYVAPWECITIRWRKIKLINSKIDFLKVLPLSAKWICIMSTFLVSIAQSKLWTALIKTITLWMAEPWSKVATWWTCSSGGVLLIISFSTDVMPPLTFKLAPSINTLMFGLWLSTAICIHFKSIDWCWSLKLLR